MSKPFLNSIFIITLVIAMVGLNFAGDKELKLDDLQYGQIHMGGFALTQPTRVAIEAVGAGGSKWVRRLHNHWLDKHNQFAYAWILNVETREMVWRMTIDNTKASRWHEWSRTFEGDVRLDKGRYEVYFSTVKPHFNRMDDGFFSFDKLLRKMLGSEESWWDQVDRWHVTISGVDSVYSKQDVLGIHENIKNSAIIHLTDMQDGEQKHRGFTIAEGIKIKIYGNGEGFEGKMYDYGWIVDAKTRERIWEMREPLSQYGGGAVKNRRFEQTFHLKPGSYLVYYQLDGSHSPQKWNANPPYDPFFWGIAISPAEKSFDSSIVETYSEAEKQALVSIDGVGDYAYKEEAFRLEKNARIRIYALGEGVDGDMYDFGWISNRNTGEIVWKMRYHKTNHAGGAAKNRLFNDQIQLKAGDYLLHYQSDDSHSYEGWNDRPPQYPEKWGIAVFPVENQNVYKKLDADRTDRLQIIAQLKHIGNNEYLRKQFRIDDPTRIRVVCVGEGDWDEMYDYGWIKNMDNGSNVWKMRYRDTRHAGGADKNRKVDTIFTLTEGVYQVRYRSDDSHAFNRWNDDPPFNPEDYGITIYRLP